MRVGLLSTFPPRECGIATFSDDLFGALCEAPGVDGVDVIAVVSGGQSAEGPVVVTVEQELRSDYAQAARCVDRMGLDVVVVQHEYGIFGGDDGEYVLDFTRALSVPYVVTLHTVLDRPTPSQARVLRELCRGAAGVIVFTFQARQMIVDAGVADAAVVHVVPHGAPDAVCLVAAGTRQRPPRWAMQRPDEASDRFVVSSFGLLSPGKGLEVVIDAIAKLVPTHPGVHLVVAGRTHPEVVRRRGERYRIALEEQVEQLGLGEHVTFEDRFLPVSEIAELLAATDVFVTAYTSPDQIVSGALTFAVAAGRAFVSTPYPYATELHQQGAGRLVPYGDAAALADTIAELIDDRAELERLRAASRRISARWSWPEVGRATAAVLRGAISRHRASATLAAVQPELPPLRLDHLRVLVDDVGIVQHARGAVPLRQSGYCVDDVARLLQVTQRLAARDHEPGWSTMTARRALGFLEHATEARGMHNFMGYDRRWIDTPSVGDHVGRAVWALGELVAGQPPVGIAGPARDLLDRLVRVIDPVRIWPRTAAYTLLGLASGTVRSKDVPLVETLAGRLVDLHALHGNNGWDWFEPVLTYDNARIPQALVAAGRSLDRHDLVELGLRTLRWYGDQCGLPELLRLPGNRWRPKHADHPGAGDEQPLDAAALVEAEATAYTVTHDPIHARRALAAFAWFTGTNRARRPLYDPSTGGCHDGLGASGVNLNQGAESTLAYHTARLALGAAGVATIA